MNQSLFDRVAVNQDQFLNPSFWQLQSQLFIAGSGWGLGKQSLGIVPAGVYELSAEVANRQPTWTQSGWFGAYFNQQFCFSQWLPLEKSFVFLPPERQEYEVFFTPVRWIFDCSIELSQFSGQWAERLRGIESQIESLAGQVTDTTPGDPDYEFEDFEDFVEQGQDYGNVTDGGYI